MFVGESEAVWVDNGVNEPVELLHHLLVAQHGVDGPQRRCWANPLPGVNTFNERMNMSRNLNICAEPPSIHIAGFLPQPPLHIFKIFRSLPSQDCPITSVSIDK